MRPARLFIARLLAALRGRTDDVITITHQMSLDFQWLISFLKIWNGRALLRPHTVHREFHVGIRDGHAYVTEQESTTHIPTHIEDTCLTETQITAKAILIVARTMITQQDSATNIEFILADQLLARWLEDGRATDDTILNTCRCIWAIQAKWDIWITAICPTHDA